MNEKGQGIFGDDAFKPPVDAGGPTSCRRTGCSSTT